MLSARFYCASAALFDTTCTCIVFANFVLRCDNTLIVLQVHVVSLHKFRERQNKRRELVIMPLHIRFYFDLEAFTALLQHCYVFIAPCFFLYLWDRVCSIFSDDDAASYTLLVHIRVLVHIRFW